MSETNIQFYGERGIVNGILLDIYSDSNKQQEKLNKFFNSIRLFGDQTTSPRAEREQTTPPWSEGVDECKWLVEPSFAHFGDPDLIAVFQSKKDGKKYAVFFEAKLKNYIASCLPLNKEDGVVNLKGKSSKLNVQLSLRYRFTKAFANWRGDSACLYAIMESEHGYPDLFRRKLEKTTVLQEIKAFLSDVKAFYFVALTNDAPNVRLDGIPKDYAPPLMENGIELLDKEKKLFGLLTYGALEDAGVINSNEGYFGAAAKMMGLSLEQPAPVAEADESIRKEFDSITGTPFREWEEREIWADRFTRDSGLRFSKLAGSYSMTIAKQVVMKLMLDPEKGSQKLVLGLLDNGRFPFNQEGGIRPKQYDVNGRTFFFYAFEENQSDAVKQLALDYLSSMQDEDTGVDVLRTESLDMSEDESLYNAVWQKGKVTSAQFNTGLWTTLESTEGKQPLNELRVIVESQSEDEHSYELVMENISSVHFTVAILNLDSQLCYARVQKKADRFILFISPTADQGTTGDIASGWEALAESTQFRWRLMDELA